MHKVIYAIAAIGALAWSDPVWAVVQETTITLTDHGKPLPEATITLNRLTDSQLPPQPKTEKTDDSGKVILTHDEEDKHSESTVELLVTTSEGNTLTRRVVLRDLLMRDSIDVTLAPDAIAECPDLTRSDDPHLKTVLTGLTDEQLETVVSDPVLRTRILKLINTSKQSHETQEQHTQAHHSSKSVAEHKPRVTRSQHSEDSGSGHPGHPLLSTGIGIGLGVGLGTIGGHRSMGGDHGGEH